MDLYLAERYPRGLLPNVQHYYGLFVGVWLLSLGVTAHGRSARFRRRPTCAGGPPRPGLLRRATLEFIALRPLELSSPLVAAAGASWPARALRQHKAPRLPVTFRSMRGSVKAALVASRSVLGDRVPF